MAESSSKGWKFVLGKNLQVCCLRNSSFVLNILQKVKHLFLYSVVKNSGRL